MTRTSGGGRERDRCWESAALRRLRGGDVAEIPGGADGGGRRRDAGRLRPRAAASARQPATPASGPASTPATDFAATLQKRVTADAMMAHLKKLQEIADANDGNRAIGTPGYDASVDYVANTLRDKGFDVQTPEFEVHLPFADEPSLTVGGDKVAAKPLEFTKGTPPEGVSGPLVPARVEDTPGLHRIRLRRPAGHRCRRAGRPRQVSVRRQAGRRRRTRRGGADRRQQRGRRRNGRHARRDRPT